ncbi:hypothetical protein ACFYMW_39455 [Streptomyces sp. NPDC006692]|uniref:hypothetical protein n=1 Tax=unclassified Streptomyces TaxID=2593676 RepID=UPI003698EA6F
MHTTHHNGGCGSLRALVIHCLLAAVLAGSAVTGIPTDAAAATSHVRLAPAHYLGDACVANENLGEIATNFISRCRRGSIRQVFPGQHYGDTLGYLKGCRESSCNTAWKLLNDNRFKK